MEKNDKRPYEAPQLTTVTFKAERGYANSIFKLALISELAGLANVSSSLEGRESAGDWAGNDF